MAVFIEVQERAQVFEGNRPFEFLLVEVPHFLLVQHPEFQAKFVEEGFVFVIEELFDDKLEGVPVHILPFVLLVFLGRFLTGVHGGAAC